MVVADNLAAYQLFGMLGPSAICFCRLCTITSSAFHLDDFSKVLERTRQNYEAHLKNIKSKSKVADIKLAKK